MKIFVDKDIEERYTQGLYEDYLKEQIKQKDKEIEYLHSIINEVKHLIIHNDIYDYRVYDEMLLSILNKEEE